MFPVVLPRSMIQSIFATQVLVLSQVALVNGISMGGGASLMVPMKFSVVTEKTVGICSSLYSSVVVFWAWFSIYVFRNQTMLCCIL